MIKSGLNSIPRPKYASGGGGGQINSIVLMHFDGTNGSTTFTDVYGHIFSVGAGSPALSTSNPKFGTAALSLDGASSITSPSTGAFGFGTGPFTVEAWVDTSISGGTQTIAGCWALSNHWIFVFAAGSAGALNFGTETSLLGGGSTSAITTGAYHHLCAVRSSGTLTYYVDGTSVGSVSSSANIGSGDALEIGRNGAFGGTWYATGNIDELRISNVARYTSNFTPSGPFTF